MPSLVDIANLALDLVGQNQPIMALTDATPSAKVCSRNITQSIQEVLRKGRWKPARKPAVLSQLSAAPLFSWTYAYTLPPDYIRIVTFNNVDQKNVRRFLHEIQGKALLTNESFAEIIYVCDLTYSGNDINVSDANMTELFALNLASKIAWPLQQSKTLRDSVIQEYGIKLKMALAADAREEFVNPTNRYSESEWLIRRRFSTNG